MIGHGQGRDPGAARGARGALRRVRSAEDTAHLFAFEPEWGDYFERRPTVRRTPR